MCLGRRFRDLEDKIRWQAEEIKELRELIYERTRVRYGSEGPLLVVKAIEAICKHLDIRFDYVYPDKQQIGWQLITLPDWAIKSGDKPEE